MKKLFYNKEEGEFYFVTKRPKSILIEWVEHKTPDTYNSDGEVIEWYMHDFNVRWGNVFVDGKGMIVNTGGKNKKHCLSEYSDDYILIYPSQAGQPFCLELATDEDIQKEIDSCKKWGISYQYYNKLKSSISNNK